MALKGTTQRLNHEAEPYAENETYAENDKMDAPGPRGPHCDQCCTETFIDVMYNRRALAQPLSLRRVYHKQPRSSWLRFESAWLVYATSGCLLSATSIHVHS
jgi:hypothetical protein